MKLYVWKHKDLANRWYNFYPLSKVEEVKPNVISPIAIHAFFKRKEAIKYLKSLWNEETIRRYELISIDV